MTSRTKNSDRDRETRAERAAESREAKPHREGFIAWFTERFSSIVTGFIKEVVNVIIALITLPLKPFTALLSKKKPSTSKGHHEKQHLRSKRDSGSGSVRGASQTKSVVRTRSDSHLDTFAQEEWLSDLVRQNTRESERRNLKKRRQHRELWLRRVKAILLAGVFVSFIAAWVFVPKADVFRVRHIEVFGASAVSELDVRQKIDNVMSGETIYTLNQSEVIKRIEQLPFVRRVTIDRHFPSGVAITLTEHHPLALGFDTHKKRWWLISPNGRILAPGELSEWQNQVPVVRLNSKNIKAGDHVRHEPAIELLLSQPPDSTVAVSDVQVKPHALTARTASGVEIRFGKTNRLRTKLVVAERELAIARTRKAQLAYVDVAVPERPVWCQKTAPCATWVSPAEREKRLKASVANKQVKVNAAATSSANSDSVAEIESSNLDEKTPLDVFEAELSRANENDNEEAVT